MRNTPPALLVILLLAFGGSIGLAPFPLPQAGAQEIVFPWGAAVSTPQRAANGPAPYQILPRQKPRRAAAPVQIAPPKVGYAYGWFGSQPGLRWGRHFGYSQNFTQWTGR
ncbi:MAG: hypothetical protein KDA45_11210 [Planctomycetales bacterium]|nr:hypothetical protein [Planctomycetales bacterium]